MPKLEVGQDVTGPCPSCGDVAKRRIYDVGSGPELSCASCEWCWGAEGQPLQPIGYGAVVETLGFDPLGELPDFDDPDIEPRD